MLARPPSTHLSPETDEHQTLGSTPRICYCAEGVEVALSLKGRWHQYYSRDIQGITQTELTQGWAGVKPSLGAKPPKPSTPCSWQPGLLLLQMAVHERDRKLGPVQQGGCTGGLAAGPGDSAAGTMVGLALVLASLPSIPESHPTGARHHSPWT